MTLVTNIVMIILVILYSYGVTFPGQNRTAKSGQILNETFRVYKDS